MKAIIQNSLLYRFFMKLYAYYQMGAINGAVQSFKHAYPHSRFQKFWTRFCASAPCNAQDSLYARIFTALRRWLERFGDIIKQSACYRVGVAIWEPVATFLGGGIIGKAAAFLGGKGLLLMALALYLPIDYLLRSVLELGMLASVWDELLMIAAFAYVLWRIAMRRAPMQARTTPVEGYLLLFIAVSFFLMCVVSDYPAIAFDGFRAVVQYLFWFFLAVRLIEDDRDFGIFYGTLLALGIVLALHGIYQYIVAAPIPASWTSQTEESVRTRVYSITGSPNIMGSILVLFAPMAAGLMYYCKATWKKLLALCATGAMCLSILFTFSKGAWGGLVVAILVFAIFIDRRLIALMGVAGVGSLLAVPSIASRITYLFTSDYATASSIGGRAVRWETGLRLLEESNKWLGFGLGRFGGAVAMQNKIIEETDDFSYFYMDNYYLKTLVEMGYVGLIFFVILLVGFVLWSLRSIGRTSYTETEKTRVLAVSLFSGMCGVLIHCYFENIFEVPYMMAYFWAMAAAILYLGYFRKKRRQ